MSERVSPVEILRVGMTCPVGLRWVHACAAMRARIGRKKFLPYCDDDGQELIGSRVELFPQDATAETRWLTLLACALRDATAEADPSTLSELPMFIATPDSAIGVVGTGGTGRAGATGGAINAIATDKTRGPSRLAQRLSAMLGVRLDPRRIQLVRGGAPAGFRAIAMARALLEEGRDQACLVGATDSLVDARSLLEISRRRNLLTSGEADGVIPGEAAACLILGHRRARRDERRSEKSPQALATIRGLGFGHERAVRSNDLPLRADGLTAAAKAALGEVALAMHDMDFRLSDAAGDSYAFKEQSLVVTRLLRKNKESLPLWLSADSLGDVGAAAGLCGLATAIAAFLRGYAPGPRAIAFASSESGDRAAVVLEKNEG